MRTQTVNIRNLARTWCNATTPCFWGEEQVPAFLSPASKDAVQVTGGSQHERTCTRLASEYITPELLLHKLGQGEFL